MKRLSALLALLIALSVPAGVHAITLQGIKVDFTPREFSVKPGSSTTKQVTVRNISDQERAVELNISHHDQNKGEKRSRPSWFEAAPGELTLPAKSERTINVSINVPEESNLKGEYRAVLNIIGSKIDSGGPPVQTQDEEVSVGISTRLAIGIPLYATIEGTAKHKLTLQGIGAEKGEGGKTDIVVKLKNNGTVREHPSVIANFYPTDPAYKDFVIEFEISKILPGEQATVKADLPLDKVSPTKYRAMGMIRYGTNIEAGQRTFNFEAGEAQNTSSSDTRANQGKSSGGPATSDK